MLGPVQVLVVGVPDAAGAGELVAGLAALPVDGPVRCLDVFELTVSPDGQLAVDGPDPRPPSLPLFAEVVDEIAPVSSADGTWHLGEVVPAGSHAVVAVVEHNWALGLRDTMQSAGGAIRHEAWLDGDDRALLEALLAERGVLR
jgi:hypothetical protein